METANTQQNKSIDHAAQRGGVGAQTHEASQKDFQILAEARADLVKVEQAMHIGTAYRQPLEIVLRSLAQLRDNAPPQ